MVGATCARKKSEKKNMIRLSCALLPSRFPYILSFWMWRFNAKKPYRFDQRQRLSHVRRECRCSSNGIHQDRIHCSHFMWNYWESINVPMCLAFWWHLRICHDNTLNAASLACTQKICRSGIYMEHNTYFMHCIWMRKFHFHIDECHSACLHI